MENQTTQLTQPKLFSQCTYYNGNTRIGITLTDGKPAVIIWDANDDIGVYLYDPQSMQYTGVVVKARVSDLKDVSVVLATLTFFVGGRLYYVDFDEEATRSMRNGFLGASTAALVVRGAVGPGAISSGVGYAAARTGIANGENAETMSNDSGIDQWIAAFKTAGVQISDTNRKFMAKSTKLGYIAGVVIIVIIVVGVIMFSVIRDI